MEWLVMDLERLSSNIIAIIDAILKNQSLVNYIGYDKDNPENQSIDPKTIAPKGSDERIFAYPFDINFRDKVRTQLHIYYPSMEFKNNGNVNQAIVLFDIVVHKNIWLLTDNNRKLIRPYQIIKFLVETFRGKNINGLGQLHFIEGNHIVVNDQFEGFRLVAKVTEF
jgi:hypothetical protein